MVATDLTYKQRIQYTDSFKEQTMVLLAASASSTRPTPPPTAQTTASELKRRHLTQVHVRAHQPGKCTTKSDRLLSCGATDLK